MLGATLSGGAFGGLEEGGSQSEGPVDELGLIGVAGGTGLEEAVEGEVDGVRGRRGVGVGKGQEGF